jgi:SAM-dependent methyltransferase
LTFEQDYFSNRKYEAKADLVRRHVLSVLTWASKSTGINLLDGKGKTALDVGCAYGYTSQTLCSLGYETCGVDISAWGTKHAKQCSDSQFLVCDAQGAFPFAKGKFDIVTCFDVLEHLPNPKMALLGMFESSKSVIVATTPNKTVEKPIRKLMRDYDETHISTKSQAEWKKTITGNLNYKYLQVDTFHDFALRFGKKLFYKSVNIPHYGLTVRIAIKK